MKTVKKILVDSLRQTDFQHCVCCNQGVMHDNQVAFYVVTLAHMVADIPAIRRQHGFETFIGNPAIAAVMGDDPELARAVDGAVRVFVCQECSMHRSIAEIAEIAAETEEELSR